MTERARTWAQAVEESQPLLDATGPTLSLMADGVPTVTILVGDGTDIDDLPPAYQGSC